MEKRKSNRRKFYVIYTCFFIIIAAAVYAPFFLQGKSLVWKNDGLYQHYNAFAYLGVYCRKIIKTLLFEHRLIFPMWEFGLGYGEDILTTLSYYAFGDPLNLISVFTPVKYAEIAYSALIPFRVYLAGIAFCMYCKKMNCKREASLCGAFVYCFSGFVLFAGVRHPYFVNPMIYMPMIFLGIEKILRKERSIFYVGMIFVATLSNYYFFYMLAILTVVYVLVRYPFEKGSNVKGGLLFCLKIGLLSLLGMGMAAVIFIPVIFAFAGNARNNSAYEVAALFNSDYYRRFFGALVSNMEAGAWVHLGLSSAGLLGIGLLFLRRAKDIWLKIWFLVLTGFLMFPMVGYLFNGFAYVSHRWCFGYCFVCAFIFAKMLPELFLLSWKKQLLLFLEVAVYVWLCRHWQETQTENIRLECMILIIAFLWVVFGPKVTGYMSKLRFVWKNRILYSGMMLLIAAGILINSFELYHYSRRNYVKEFAEIGHAYDIIARTDGAAWDLIEDDSFYRIDDNAVRYYFAAEGQSTTSEYWSLVSPYLAEYMMLNSSYATVPYTIAGLRSRAFLLPFASAKYFVDAHNNKMDTPYGYESVGETLNYREEAVQLFKTENVLPLGYTCDAVIMREEYENLTIAQRQQAMLQGAVVETKNEENVSGLKRAEPKYSDIPLEYEIVNKTNLKVKDGKFVAKKANASMELAISCPEKCELYVEFCGLNFKGARQTRISASNGEKSSGANHYTPKAPYTHGREDYFLNLFYSDKERDTITITFEKKGTYAFDSFSVIAQPMEGFEEQVDAMKEDILENVKISENNITGEITLETEKLLCLSVPYSTGWKVLVDGKEEELLRTNIMYMGVVLDAGKHLVELKYTTPYLNAGVVVSVICWGIFMVLVFVGGKKKSSDIKSNMQI